jgi:formate dehydrogenase assembly factor FdhD
MKTAQAAISAILASSTSFCAQQPKLVKALAQSAKPPTGVAAAAWKEPYRTVKNIAEDLRPAVCGRHRAADEQIGSAFQELHDNFYKLVLLVPPR